jgi:hypothetical protein
LVDTSQILFRGDYPFSPEIFTGEPIKGITTYDGFDDEAKRVIEQKNALKLFIPKICRVMT